MALDSSPLPASCCLVGHSFAIPVVCRVDVVQLYQLVVLYAHVCLESDDDMNEPTVLDEE